jgi:hypothetical protein
MKSVQARIDVELFLENRGEADVTHLTRVDCNVLVSLLSLLLSQNLSVLGMLLELLFQVLDLVIILVQTFAQMLFHLLNLSFFWKQWKQIINLQYRIL